jgi:hypothetical protein
MYKIGYSIEQVGSRGKRCKVAEKIQTWNTECMLDQGDNYPINLYYAILSRFSKAAVKFFVNDPQINHTVFVSFMTGEIRLIKHAF